MKIHRIYLNSFLFYTIVFLTFLGFYSILLVSVNAGMSGTTRLLAMPVRIVIVASLILLSLLNFRWMKIMKETQWFLFFAGIYLFRIIVDLYRGETYYLSTEEVFLYFISFSVIPFFIISTFNLNERYLTKVFKALFLSGFIFSILSFFYYSRFIGQVGRLASSTAGEDVISPLVLSYCATLIIGVLIAFFLYNKVSKWEKLLGIVVVSLSIVPFFLGASRGSLVALFLPFIFILISGKNIQYIIRSLFLIVILVIGLIYLDNVLGSGLLDRFLGISEAVEAGSSSASRLDIWTTSIHQFLENPFVGDKLSVNGYEGYPHNLFIEVLQTTGILGFIPFLILVSSGFKFCFRLFKEFPEFSWVAVIFLQSFFYHMFSGAIYTAAWFWTSMAIVFSLKTFLENRRFKK